MVLRMKNFNILGVLRKIWLVEGGAHENGQFVDLRGAWQKSGGGVFEGGCYTNAHYGSANMLLESKESRENSLNLSNNKMVILYFFGFQISTWDAWIWSCHQNDLCFWFLNC